MKKIKSFNCELNKFQSIKKFSSLCIITLGLFFTTRGLAQNDSIVIKDIQWDKAAPAGSTELFIPSDQSMLAGFIYRANGTKKHPTLLLLHGYPGNERNLDLAQVIRSKGWNVLYFNYRGSWGSPGKFSFKHCVEDVGNVIDFCKKYQDSLRIDTSNIVLFGHSMGAWVCLKSLQTYPEIKKGFALSTWNIFGDFKDIPNENALLSMVPNPDEGGKYFVLNASFKETFLPVIQDQSYFDLTREALKLSNKQLLLLDEHSNNKTLASVFQSSHPAFFEYLVWQTDHSFTNKRASLINKVISFLEK